MTMSKKTVPQIKSELDTLGVEYSSTLRKAELLSLLQEKLTPVEDDTHYSPPYTRRRKTMAAVHIQTVTTDLLKLDSSPLNHASAGIYDLEADNNQSEEVSIDVKITKEKLVQDEHVISNGTETPVSAETLSSEVTDSDEELAKAVEEIREEKSAKKRRSLRLAQRKQHPRCPGTLFSDDELTSPEPKEEIEADSVSITSSEEARSTERKSLLFKIFLVSILFAIVANIIAYVHLSHPELLATLQRRLYSTLKRFKSSSTPAALPAE